MDIQKGEIHKKKKCCGCKEILLLKEFYRRGDRISGHRSECIQCSKEFKQKRTKTNTQKLYQYLQGKCCIDCGEIDPLTLTFDHINPEDKKTNLAQMWSRFSWVSIEIEIAKCEIRCANCHNKKTAKDRKYYLWRFIEEQKNSS